MIALCTVLCGGQGAVDMALFARAKEPFLRGFLKLANGVPSHDTFSRLFRQLDPAQFRAAFQRFMAGFSKTMEGVVAIDGKVLRRSFDRASGKSPLHMVSAWGCEQRLVLAQIATDAKSNEITAVPKLLEMLSLKGTIVTDRRAQLPARHRPARSSIRAAISLALKGNQGTLHDDVTPYLDDPASEVSVGQADRRCRSRPHRNPHGDGLDRYRLAAGGSSMARPGRDRQGGPHPRNREQDHDRDRLLSAQHTAVRRNASTRSSARIGGSKTACIGASMS